MRSLIQHIRETCDLASKRINGTTIFEDNISCIVQMKKGYVKGDIKKKLISPKLFFTHDLHKNDDIDIRQIYSCDNLSDLFTKSLPSKKKLATCTKDWFLPSQRRLLG